MLFYFFKSQGNSSFYTIQVCSPKTYDIFCANNKEIQIRHAEFGRIDRTLTCTDAKDVNTASVKRRKRRNIFR